MRDRGKDRPILFKRARFIVVALIILLSLMLFSTNLPASSASQKATKNVDIQVALLAISDPTVNLPSVADAQTSQKYPDANYGTNPLMYSGNMIDSLSYRSYLRFDLSPIPTGAIINSATLIVYVASATGSPTIEVRSAVQGWTESTVTWNNQPIPSALIIDSQVISSSPGFVSWDITSLVSMWFGGKVFNNGICLKGPTSAESYAQFHTREGSNPPYIQITYELTYPPGVTTADASGITTSSAALNGNLDSTGGLACQVWFEYGETESYGSSTSLVSKSSTGPFSAVTLNLTPDTAYHFRACASNSEGTVCGSDMIFKTGKDTYPPGVTTADASSITTSSAALNGNLDSTGGLACQVWFEYGETESYGSSTTSVSESSTGPFSAVIPGLTPDTTYHFRACASNSEGTVCGSGMTFKTGKETYPPGVTTTDASSITTTSAALNGNLDSTGGLACQVWFEYGETESYGSSTSSASKSSTGSFSAVIAGLTPDTTYHFRACASNSEGTVCGSDMTFKTGKDTYPPQVSISYSPESPNTNEEVTFTAEASDDSGIKKIQIFVSGDKAHECSESPCIYVGGPYPEGMVNYSAKAWDKEDNMAITEDKSFKVEPAHVETECPRWDINEDCIVDYLDLAVLSHHYGEASQSPYPRWDINEDGTAELRDLSLLAAHFMEIACECTEDMKKEIEKIPSMLHPQLQNLPWQ